MLSYQANSLYFVRLQQGCLVRTRSFINWECVSADLVRKPTKPTWKWSSTVASMAYSDEVAMSCARNMPSKVYGYIQHKQTPEMRWGPRGPSNLKTLRAIHVALLGRKETPSTGKCEGLPEPRNANLRTFCETRRLECERKRPSSPANAATLLDGAPWGLTQVSPYKNFST